MRIATSLSTSFAVCLAALLSTGSAAATEGPFSADVGVASSTSCDDESVFLFPSIGQDQYLSYQRVLIDAPVSEVWPVLRDIEWFAEAVLPEVAPTFLWLNGGGPETIPSAYQFTSGGVTLVEEIIYRSEAHHQILVRLLEPAFGMEQYYALGDLTPCGDQTVLEYTRYLELAPGTDIAFFTALFTQEFIDIPAYFEQ
ncbi:hypothetical protein BE04_04715 [Sorangium cellulosum]|uniref:Secreted protein n=2 Tax=Sorangium cellulosum TaxID=56 RepID=A0A150PF23_SORCE|nr:SRPBCC family protein [Sorangium cellulosum]AGP34712.1 hypothetical protein SCE1572_09445 [Sorangium cellulosum So0157-2]KYF54250.1 hypothetical protein BE04_04715 [Sorangium cellulosum]